MLKTCDEQHAMICFEATNRYDDCPICKLLEELDDQIDELNDDIRSLRIEVSDLEKQLDE